MKINHFYSLCFLAALTGSSHADVSSILYSMQFTHIDYTIGDSSYDYYIGKHEVTQGQWNMFLSDADNLNNQQLADSSSFGNAYGGPYDWAQEQESDNVPATRMSWFQAAQFCNYLTSGTLTEGAYNFNTDGSFAGINSSPLDDNATIYALPTKAEWNLAAYYNGTRYTQYANGTDNKPSGWDSYTVMPDAHINFPGNEIGDTTYDPDTAYPPFDVGSFKEEQNKTYDMMGNVWEWIEEGDVIGGSSHGSGFIDYPSNTIGWNNEDESSWLGFRPIVYGDTSAIPEPASLAMIGLTTAGALMVRRWFMI